MLSIKNLHASVEGEEIQRNEILQALLLQPRLDLFDQEKGLVAEAAE
jgi:Fe-S cluster assembly ATPase SufC